MTRSQKQRRQKEGAPSAARAGEFEFSRVRSADRALDLLELLAARGEGVGFNEMLEALELPRSSLSTLLRTLTTRRYVTRTNDGKRFRLGSKVLDLSAGYRHNGNPLEVAVQAMRSLARQTGGFSFPLYVIGLLGTWFVIGALPLLVRRGIVPAPIAWLVAAGLGALAAWLGTAKPI